MKANQDAFYENERLGVRIVELEDALRPFAERKMPNTVSSGSGNVTWWTDCLRARKVLDANF